MTGRLARKRIDIERLVSWALVEQGLGSLGRDLPVREDFSDYGGAVDVSPVAGLPSVQLWTDDDALVVHESILSLSRIDGQMSRAVMQYGRASSRPDWGPEGYGELEQMRNKRGQPMWDHAVPGNRRSPRTPRMDHWAHSRRKAMVDFCRAEYAIWWRGLERLVPMVNNRTASHLAIGPKAPREPWTLPFDGELPAAAQARLAAYGRRDPDWASEEALLGDVGVEAIRAAAQAPVSDMATVLTTETRSGVEVAWKRDRVAEVGEEALRRTLEEREKAAG